MRQLGDRRHLRLSLRAKVPQVHPGTGVYACPHTSKYNDNNS